MGKRRPVRGVVMLVALALLAGNAAAAAERPAHPPLDTQAIALAIGKAGEWHGEVYKIALPRTDLGVSVNGIKIKPGLALSSWIAFTLVQRSTTQAVVHGDLVVTEAEINPVISQLQKERIQIVAVHNHLLRESPRMMYVHVWGKGDAATLALGLKSALSEIKTPIASPQPGNHTVESEQLAATVQRLLGRQGRLKDGVLSVAVPRREAVAVKGVTVPSPMGMATALNFQAAGNGKVAATGDFVLAADEVVRVARALREHDIEITALHNHLINEAPDLYFLHFWAHATAEEVATGLKRALEAMKQ